MSMLAIKPDAAALANLQEWQCAILEMAAAFFCTPAQKELQGQAGIWDSSETPYPSRHQITILPSSCLVFDVVMTNPMTRTAHAVHFSVWMTAGEVRIGAKIPVDLVNSAALHNELSCSYDGKPCSREAAIGNTNFFDWIFREDFASFEAIIRAMKDPLLGAVLSRRIGEILTHLYFTLMKNLSTSIFGDILFKPDNTNPTKTLRLVSVSGNKESFEASVIDVRGRILRGIPSESEPGHHLYWVETEGHKGCLAINKDGFDAREIYPRVL